MAGKRSEFVDYLAEIFQSFGAVRARRMFGGFGLYHDDLMFGIVSADVLYLKADAKSAPFFVERGLAQFEYLKQNKPVRLSFYAAPEEIFDDPDLAKEWATRAFEAAVRSRRN
jgi:DNA transformation protein